MESNLAPLKSWQKIFKGDSFDYDYHAVGAHFADPGFADISRVMFEDMKSLKDIGINGMMSCQVQRVFFPTSLLMEAMVRTLWNRDTTFEAIVADFFPKVYGDDGIALFEYFDKISKAFDIGFIRGYKKHEDADEHIKMLSVIPGLLDSFKPVIDKNVKLFSERGDEVRAHLWKLLSYHSVITRYQYEMLTENLKDNIEKSKEICNRAKLYLESIEPETREVLDDFRMKGSFGRLCTPFKSVQKHQVGVAQDL